MSPHTDKDNTCRLSCGNNLHYTWASVVCCCQLSRTTRIAIQSNPNFLLFLSNFTRRHDNFHSDFPFTVQDSSNDCQVTRRCPSVCFLLVIWLLMADGRPIHKQITVHPNPLHRSTLRVSFATFHTLHNSQSNTLSGGNGKGTDVRTSNNNLHNIVKVEWLLLFFTVAPSLGWRGTCVRFPPPDTQHLFINSFCNLTNVVAASRHEQQLILFTRHRLCRRNTLRESSATDIVAGTPCPAMGRCRDGGWYCSCW